MNDESRGLVDDQQVFVLVGDPQLALFGLEGDVLPLPDVHLKQLPADKPVTLQTWHAIQAHSPGRKQALGLGARSNLRQRGDESVQPLAGSFG